jgi:hypothetical protein
MLGPTSILPYVIDIPYLRLADGCLAWVTNETLPGLFDYQYLDGEEKYRFAFSEQNAAFQFKMRWL